ncbi:MAG: hypothetical protein H5T43_07130 [Methanomethylovorans sp.]|jgi:hypothetical protein|nr:hypothetical protein [Methanomethylovorans sp.]
MEEIDVPKNSTFNQQLIAKVREVIKPREGACGICHAIAEEICRAGGRIVAYERPKGILARIIDEKGNVAGEGFGIVWSVAILAAEFDAGLIPSQIAESLKREGINTQEDIDKVADLYGYGRVLTPAGMALMMVKEMGGRTLIRREGLGVVATFLDDKDNIISTSPPAYCPTCAITIGAARTSVLATKIKESLRDIPNTGKKKSDLGLENIYEVKDGHVRVTLAEGDRILANRVVGCCMAYATIKAEIVADLVPKASAQLFRTYCNLCPYKHCWMEKSMGATGNIILHRLSEIGTEVEVTAEGGIMVHLKGEKVEGRGTLCSLSALTNLLLRGDAQNILKPSSTRRWEKE